MGLVGRSLRRRPGRTAMMIAAVAVAVALLVALQSLAAGFLQSQTADVRERPIDVILQPLATRGDPQLTGPRAAGIDGAHALSRALASTSGIVAASPTLEAVITARDARGNATLVLAQGVIPAGYTGALSDSQRASFDGWFDAPDDATGQRPQVILNTALAQKLGVARNGTAMLSATADDAPRAYTVVGIVATPHTGSGLFGGEGIALMPLSQLQALTGTDARDAATQIALRLDAPTRADAAKSAALLAKLRADHPGYQAITKEQELAQAEERGAVSAAFYSAVAYVALVVSALFVASVMVMEVQQRRRDLGVLRAIGFGRASVFRLVAGEALLYVAIGTVLGIALGYWTSEALSRYFQAGYGLAISFTRFTPGLAAASALQSMAVGVLAALYPAWAATRVDPLTILRSAR